VKYELGGNPNGGNNMTSVELVYQALRGVNDPELKRNLVELGMVREVQLEDGRVRLRLALTSARCSLKEQIVAAVTQAILALEDVQRVDVTVEEMSSQEKQRLASESTRPGNVEHLNHIDHVIAVMSGKGGVGKSFVSSLLAVVLRQKGHTVGLLDADITGPSLPKMFFPDGARLEFSPIAILPAETRTGLKLMSINLLLEREDQAVVWRGPLIGGAIRQFWGEVLWGNLDYLVVDLPPGTSDASLTVMQSLPLSGVVLVSAPQNLAGMVVRKAAQMAQLLQVPLLGLVENMSYFVCPDTGRQYAIFGPSHGEEVARALGVPFLGRLPIDPRIASLCDAGRIEDYPIDDFKPMADQIEQLALPARPPRLPHA
jgi:Mrp family chromosome partitioning ATPase